MARLQYQPATKPREFQPIQLSRAGIARMEEESNRIIRGMERQRDAEIRQRDSDLQDMKENSDYERRARDRNQDIETRNFENEQLAIKNQAKARQAQQKADQEVLNSTLGALVDFSVSAGKVAAQRTKQMISDQAEEGRQARLTEYRNNPEAQNNYNTTESQLGIETVKYDNVNYLAEAKGFQTPNETSKNLLANPGRSVYWQKGYYNQLVKDQTPLLLNRAFQSTKPIFTDQSGNQFSGIEAVNNPTRTTIVLDTVLKNLYGSTGLNISELEPGFLNDSNEFVDKLRDSYITRSLNNQTKQNYEVLKSEGQNLRDSDEIVQAFLLDLKNPLIGREKSLQNVFDLYSAKNADGSFRYSKEYLDNLNLLGDGTILKIRGNSQRYQDAIAARRKSRTDTMREDQARTEVEAKDFTRFVAIPQLIALTNQESDKRDPLIFESFKALWPQKFPGVAYPQTLVQAEQVAIAKNIEKEDNMFAVRAASIVPLTEQEIATIQNPATKIKYQAIFKEQQIKRFGPEYPKVLKSLKAKAISVAGFDPTVDGSINATTTFLLSAMQKKVEEYALEGEKSGVKPEFIPEYSVNKLNEYLAKAPTDKKNLFYKDPNSPDNAPNFPNLYGTAQTKQDRADANMIDKLVAKYNFDLNKIINMPYALGGQDDYERISAQIEKDPLNVEYTAEIMKISRMTQRTRRPMSPREVYNASIAKVNAVSMKDPVIANEVNPVEDSVYQLAPEVQKLYSDVSNRTFNRLRRVGAEITNSNGGRNAIPMRASMQSTGLQGLADLVSSGEGSATSMFPSENYPEMLDMTIATELVDFQNSKLRDGRASAAAGSYQFLYPEQAAKLAGLPPDAKFTPENQTKMFIATIMNKPGRESIGQYLLGNSDDIELAIDQLSQEFASIEYRDGRSYYEDGVNKASISRDQVRKALLSSREELTN